MPRLYDAASCHAYYMLREAWIASSYQGYAAAMQLGANGML
jgi:hypothetical protein